MRIPNTFALVLVTALTTVVVVTFLSYASHAPWFRFPLTAILAYGLAMAVIVIARRIAPVSLPKWYMTIRPFEDNGRLYLRFGIRTFRKLLVIAGIDVCNWLVHFTGRRAGFQNLAQAVRRAETYHLISFLAVLLVFVYALTREWLEVAGWLALVNVVANLYPVMLQRHNRARIEALLVRAPDSKHARLNDEPASDSRPSNSEQKEQRSRDQW